VVAQVEVVVADDSGPEADGTPDGQQWEWLQRRLAPRLPAHRLCLTELCRAYEEATGTLIGCD
jgi:hypothetical protein